MATDDDEDDAASDDCRCEFSLLDFSKSEDTRLVEYGPAYNDVLSGEVTLGRRWKPNKQLWDFLLPDCCDNEKYDPEAFMPEFHWSMVGVLGSILLLSLVGVVLLRDHQPIRFRQADQLVVFGVFAMACQIFTLAYVAGDATSPVWYMCFVLFFFEQIVLWYQACKQLQMGLLFRWGEARAAGDRETMKWFFDHKYLASPYIFYIGAGVVSVVGIILVSISASQVEMSSPQLRYVRCHWWELPERYTVVRNASSICPCYDWFMTGDDNKYESNCTVALGTECHVQTNLLPTHSLPGLSTNDLATMCAHCLPTTDEYDDELCGEDIVTWMATGACGWPSLSPALRACSAPPGSLRAQYYTGFVMLYVEVFFIAAMVVVTARMDDKFFVRVEGLGTVCTSLPGMAFATYTVLNPDFSHGLRDHSSDYSLIIILIIIAQFFSWFWSLLLPLIIAIVWWVQDQQRNKDDEHPMSQAAHSVAGTFSSTVGRRDTVPAGVIHMNRRRAADVELAFALQNKVGGYAYTQFALKEFSLENFQFLQAIVVAQECWLEHSRREIAARTGSPGTRKQKSSVAKSARGTDSKRSSASMSPLSLERSAAETPMQSRSGEVGGGGREAPRSTGWSFTGVDVTDREKPTLDDPLHVHYEFIVDEFLVVGAPSEINISSTSRAHTVDAMRSLLRYLHDVNSPPPVLAKDVRGTAMLAAPHSAAAMAAENARSTDSNHTEGAAANGTTETGGAAAATDDSGASSSAPRMPARRASIEAFVQFGKAIKAVLMGSDPADGANGEEVGEHGERKTDTDVGYQTNPALQQASLELLSVRLEREEVKRLIQCDSFPRFRSSPEFQAFQDAFEEEQAIGAVLGELGVQSDDDAADGGDQSTRATAKQQLGRDSEHSDGEENKRGMEMVNVERNSDDRDPSQASPPD